MALILRRGSTLQRLGQVFPVGEPILDTDTYKLYIGDGQTAGGVLVTGDTSNTELAADASPTLGGNLNLGGYDITGQGNINIDGYINATGNIALGNDENDEINISGLIDSDLKPAIASAFNIGRDERRWNVVYAERGEFAGDVNATSITTTSIIGGDSTVVWDSNTATLNATNVTAANITGDLAGIVTGSLVGDVYSADGNFVILDSGTFGSDAVYNGRVNGDIYGDVIADNGIVILNSGTDGTDASFPNGVSGTFDGLHTGRFDGDLTGSVYSDNSSLLVDGVNNTLNGTLNTGQLTYEGDSITSDIFSLRIGTDDKPLSTEFALGDGSLLLKQTLDGGIGGYISSNVANGTLSNRQAVNAGDDLGGFVFNGYTDANTVAAGGIISFFVDSTANITPGSNFVKTQVAIVASSDTAQDPSNALVLDSAGTMAVNTVTANLAMQLPVYADDAARTTGIPTPAKGMMIFMEAGTAPAATNQTQVFDGSQWVTVS